MADTELRTWFLTEDEIELTTAKLAKINARAAKNGLEGQYTWTFGEERHTPVYDETDVRMVINGVPHTWIHGPVPCAIVGFKHEHELVVFGDAPKLEGWKFVASLTWDGGALITRCTPGFEGRIDDSQIRPGACDHCNLDRQRYDCYLLEAEDGHRVQVGSSCIKDFLGHEFRPSMLSYSDDLDNLFQEVSGGGHADLTAPALIVLGWAASISSQTGWVSRAKAEEWGTTASGGVIQECLFGTGKLADKSRALYQPTEDHHAEAVKVLSWALALEPGNSEYLANVKRVATLEWVSFRNVAILGSAVASFWREHNERIEREAQPVSQFVGEQKQRLVLELTVRGETCIDGDYGVTHLYTLTDTTGNVFKWFSSRNQNWERGQEVRVKATVKGHETYKDVRQTVITRCAAA